MRVSKETTLDSSEGMVFCVEACCACNELDSSTVDSSWFKSIVRRRNSSSMTDSGLGECERRSSSSDKWDIPKPTGSGSSVFPALPS
jgi:hypothetical protein